MNRTESEGGAQLGGGADQWPRHLAGGDRRHSEVVPGYRQRLSTHSHCRLFLSHHRS